MTKKYLLFLWVFAAVWFVGRVKANPVAVALTGKVVNGDEGNAIAGAEVSIKDLSEDTQWKQITDKNGQFVAYLTEAHQYQIVVKHYSFFAESGVVIETREDKQSMNVEFKLRELVIGRTIRLDHLNFHVNENEIADESLKDIAKLYETLHINPDMVIEIGVHTDSRGDEAHNLALSQQRAEVVKAQLIRHGIDADRLIAIGYGETLPINHCTNGVKCTTAEHIQNRRVEFVLRGLESK